MKKPCTGDIVTIDGHRFCVGEKIISKWKYSKLNRTQKKKKNKKSSRNVRRRKTVSKRR